MTNSILKLSLLFITFSILLFSCSKEFDWDKHYEIRKNNLIGDWDCELTYTAYRNGVLDVQGKQLYQYSFYADGTVLYGPDDITHTNALYKWYYQYDPEKIIIKNLDSGLLGSSLFSYSVVQNDETFIICREDFEYSKNENGTEVKIKQSYERIFKRK